MFFPLPLGYFCSGVLPTSTPYPRYSSAASVITFNPDLHRPLVEPERPAVMRPVLPLLIPTPDNEVTPGNLLLEVGHVIAAHRRFAVDYVFSSNGPSCSRCGPGPSLQDRS